MNRLGSNNRGVKAGNGRAFARCCFKGISAHGHVFAPGLGVTSSGAVVMITWPRRSSIKAISLRKAESVNDRNASMRGATVADRQANSRWRSWTAAAEKFIQTGLPLRRSAVKAGRIRSIVEHALLAAA
jgi:hypothetical protein